MKQIILIDAAYSVPRMWFWFVKEGKVYGGIIREGKDDLYIWDKGKKITLSGCKMAFTFCEDRYPMRGVDD